MSIEDRAELALLQAMDSYLESLQGTIEARPNEELNGPLLAAIGRQRRKYADQIQFLERGKR